ncbi:tetratricopeptide repeat protein [Vibrio sp. JC009]|uniref:tetratricopeptide repeat protein n=1 Tax=Vibrio sp. JC009 TaxID=2912314 RepID=UPI0023B0D0DC|nr:tetratricopeptide repeat protein [Vibrio sp. JC009]WED21196.1 tetratricopeptide repeat protein [Vibrio sp. JC009]
MLYRIISLLLVTFLLSFSLNVRAETSTPLLDDAVKLIEINPQQSLDIAYRYLSSRKLVTEQNAKGRTMGRDDSEADLRTPITTIEALLIVSRSHLALKNGPQALEYADQAEAIARKYGLFSLTTEAQIHKASVLWQTSLSDDKVRPLLTLIEESLKKSQLDKLSINKFWYQLTVQKAQIASSLNQTEPADNLFEQAKVYLSEFNDPHIQISYAQELGKHNLRYMRFNQALYSLLGAYWQAVEKDLPDSLAKTNRMLADLYIKRNALDKALDHLSQAADFYDNYGDSPVLSGVLNDMANIYYQQGRYNLALVYYFNVLDGESMQSSLEKVIELRLNLANTYLQLYNYPLAEQYVNNAESLLSFTLYEGMKARSLLIQAELDSQLNQKEQGINKALKALELGKKVSDREIEIAAHLLLSSIYHDISDYKNALSHLQTYNNLTFQKRNQLSEITEEDFVQQQQFIGKSIHYKSQEEQLTESRKEIARYRNIGTAVLLLSALLFALFLYRGVIIRRMKTQLSELYKDHYTHPRSGLRNLRLLNVKLPSSLEKSSANFEQWQTGELIHEPLHDKLRFIMIDLPFLKTTYLKKGYKAGLELERNFGEFIKSKIESPARLYHFSDAMFLYVTPNTNPQEGAEQLFEKFNQWIAEFEPEQDIEKVLRAGIADYPFLPKAYTAINDKELIDILLMALDMARKLTIEHSGNHWVNLKAIDNAPAASFAGDDIRAACEKAAGKGLIKIHSSYKIEEDIIDLESTD